MSLLLASLILLFIFIIFPERTEKHLKEELETLAKTYYEEEFKVLMPKYLETHKELTIDLESLNNLGKDITEFEKNECDYTETKATLYYEDEDNYRIEVNLVCKG